MSEAAQRSSENNTKHRIAVADILENDRVVLNVGVSSGVKVGQRYLIYKLSEDELIDPITEESLGKVEIPKGTGKITHAQERISILESDKENTQRSMSLAHMWDPSLFPTSYNAPFRSPVIGDLVKRIY